MTNNTLKKSICIYQDYQEKLYGPLLRELHQSRDALVREARTTAELERIVHETKIDLLILLFSQDPSDKILDFISKNRNAVNLRSTYTLAVHGEKSTSQGIQKTLMIGAKSIFMKPVGADKVLWAVQNFLRDKQPSALEIPPRFQPISAQKCEIEVFGRVGKFYLGPLGDLQVETNANFEVGHSVTLKSAIASDNAIPEFHYLVSAKSNEDQYYNYAYNYYLSLSSTEEDKKRLNAWVEKNRSAFTFPKTKVLWISDHFPDKVEQLFEKKIFSLYFLKPGNASIQHIEDINPRIIITGTLEKRIKKELETWHQQRERSSSLIFSTDPDVPLDWRFVASTSWAEFKTKIMEVVTPFLKSRVSDAVKTARYFDRKSNYSRMSISLKAEISHASNHHVRLRTSTEIFPETIVLVQCPQIAKQHELGFFLKIVETEKREHDFEVIGEMIPFTDTPNPILQALNQSASSGSSIPTSISEKTGQKTDLFFLQEKKFSPVLKWILAIAGVLLLVMFYYLSQNQPEWGSQNPATMEEALRSIRNAFGGK